MTSIINVLITLVKFEKGFIMLTADTFITKEFANQLVAGVGEFVYNYKFLDLAKELHSLVQMDSYLTEKVNEFKKTWDRRWKLDNMDEQLKKFNNLVQTGNEEGVEDDT